MSAKILNQQKDYKHHYIIWANKELTFEEKNDAIGKYHTLHPEIEPYNGQTIEFDLEDVSQDE
jgi:hypothetical protein